MNPRTYSSSIPTGLDHLLPWAEFHTKVRIREDESSATDAKELQVACFMGLVAYFADRPEVLRVSPLHMPETFNAVSRAVIQSADVKRTPLSDAGLDGTGQVVQVKRVSFSFPLLYADLDVDVEADEAQYRSAWQASGQASGSGPIHCDRVVMYTARRKWFNFFMPRIKRSGSRNSIFIRIFSRNKLIWITSFNAGAIFRWMAIGMHYASTQASIDFGQSLNLMKVESPSR